MRLYSDMDFLPARDPAERPALLARRDKSALPFPTHSKADVKAARNMLYLQSKGAVPKAEIGVRYGTVLTNDNLRRSERAAELAVRRKFNLLALCPTIER